MFLYLSVTAENEVFAGRCWRHLAHMDYRVGADGHLLRHSRPKNGLIVLTDEGSPSFSDPKTLSREVLRECRDGSFHGVVADFERPPAGESVRFLRLLGENLRYEGKSFFVTEPYSLCAPNAKVLLPSALSGGNFCEHLKRGVHSVGKRRAVLDLEWLRMDFPLPCPSGEGTVLTERELRELHDAEQAVSFYSQPLAADYFGYARREEHHFVLYDTPETLSKKIRIASSLGCDTVFLMVSEAGEELPTLLQLLRRQRLI